MPNPNDFQAKLDAALQRAEPVVPTTDEKLAEIARLSLQNQAAIRGLIMRSNRQWDAIINLNNEAAALAKLVLDMHKSNDELRKANNELAAQVAKLTRLQDERRGDWLASTTNNRWN